MCFLFLTLTFCSQKPKDTVIKCYVLLLNLGFYPNVYNLYLIRSFLSFVFFLHLPLICSTWHTWIHFHLMGELCYKHRQYHLASQSPPPPLPSACFLFVAVELLNVVVYLFFLSPGYVCAAVRCCPPTLTWYSMPVLALIIYGQPCVLSTSSNSVSFRLFNSCMPRERN